MQTISTSELPTLPPRRPLIDADSTMTPADTPLTIEQESNSTAQDEREPTFRQVLRPFWFVGALLMMLDGLTTYLALSLHGDSGAKEGNPLGVWAIEHIGLAGMCIMKVLIGVLMMWRLASTVDRGHRFTWLDRSFIGRKQPVWKVRRNAAWALAFSLVLMGVVVGNNVRAIVDLSTR
jgi:hypothetical protein